MSTRRMAPDARRASILLAARDLFGQRAYAAVSVADLARAADASPPLIMFYFGTKKSLYRAVVEASVEAIRDGVLAQPGPPSIDRLAASVTFYAEYARTHRTGFLSFLRGGQDATLPEVASIVEALRVELTTQIVNDLAATSPDLDATTPATFVGVRGYLGNVDSMIISWLSLPEEQRALIDPELIAKLAVGAFSGALAVLKRSAPQRPTPAPAAVDPSIRGSR
jgi:AcrR family transcriptional regulator